MTQVILLTTTDCHLCHHARQVLDRVAANHPIGIEEVTVESERGRRIAQEVNLVFPPGVLLDGQLFSYGRLSERKLRKTLTNLPRDGGDQLAAGRPPPGSGPMKGET